MRGLPSTAYMTGCRASPRCLLLLARHAGVTEPPPPQPSRSRPTCPRPPPLECAHHTQAIQGAGHRLDHTATDLRIALGLASCVLAAVAHFYPEKAPHAWWVGCACVAGYVLLSVALSVLARFAERGAVACTAARPGQPPVVVTSALPRWSYDYTLCLERRRMRFQLSAPR